MALARRAPEGRAAGRGRRAVLACLGAGWIAGCSIFGPIDGISDGTADDRDAGRQDAVVADTRVVEARAEGAVPAPDPWPPGTRLTGSYTCPPGRATLILTIDEVVTGEVRATAGFLYATRDPPVDGALRMAGPYDAEDLSLTLRFVSWIKQPPGYVPVEFDGVVAGDVYAGRVVTAGCGTFSATVER